METTGKARIKKAKALAKAHGVEVLGWKDKEGKETLSVKGDGDKLQLLRQEMEKEGWHMWPVEEAAEGFLMDFGMEAAPFAPEPKGFSTEVNDPIVAYKGSDYHYRGLTEAFVPYTILVCCILGILFIYPLKYQLFFLPTQSLTKQNLILAGILLIIFSGAIVSIFDWTEIYADKTKLIMHNKFRNIFLKQPQEILICNIKKIKIYSTDLGKGKSDSLIISFKSGKAVQLFLPKREREGLVSFIKSKISD